ncbi:MAG: IS630 family transposase, partial [Pseudomonadota bacterium]
MTEGVDGRLRDGSPPARHSCADRAAEIVRPTEAPPHEATPWTARAMAKTTGRAVSTVQKIWNAHGLAPRRRRSVELSSD